MLARTAIVMWWCSLAFLMLGCESSPGPPRPSTGDGLFVLNEGAFGQNNAEITYYSFVDGSVGDNMYSTINPGKILGDVANSIAEGGREAFIVVNNSNKIEIVDRATLHSTGTVYLNTSPRHMVIVSPNKGYVSNMDSTVSVVDIFLRRVTKSITVGSYPEGLIAKEGKLYVAMSGFGAGTTVRIIDIATDAILGTIDVPDGPTYFAERSDGKILLSCVGYTDYYNPSNDTDGALVVIDPTTDTVVDTLQIPGHPGKLVVGPDDIAYLIGPGSFTGGPIWKLNAWTLEVIAAPFIDGTYYAVGVDPVSLRVFAGDAAGFASNGTVEVYDRNGAKLDEFVCGVGPTWFMTSGE